jgi:hypothetical protein
MPSGCRSGGAAGKHNGGQVGDIRRLWKYDVIARTDDSTNGKINRLRSADRDDDLALGIVGDA